MGNESGMTGPRSRRALLQTGALALAGAAGCTGNFGDDRADDGASESTTSETTRTAEAARAEQTTDRATDQTSEGTTNTTVEPPLAIEGVQVQSSFFYRNYPDAAAVAGREGSQFVFVELQLAGSVADLPAPDEIALVADDQRFEGTVAPGSTDGPWELYEREDAYGTEPVQSGWIAFEVPDPLAGEQIALAYESGGRTFSKSLDTETVEILARPPVEFEIAAFEFPESVRQRESFEMSVTVETTGEVDGVFRAVLNQSHPLYGYRTIELDVPANERREWSRRSDWHVRDAERADFTLLTPVGKREATIEVVPETTTA
jgi:hypothetical protein